MSTLERMSGIKVALSKRKSLPTLSFIRETEDAIQVLYKRELAISTLQQNKYILPIVKEYQLQENELNRKLPEIAIKAVLNLSSDLDRMNEAPENFRDKLRKIVNNYGYINNEFITEMNKWEELREEVIEHLQDTTRKLQLIKQTTSAITLISSAMELARGVGTLLYTVFKIDLKPKNWNLLTWIIGGVSVTGSVIAFSYTKQTAEDIFRELREEKYFLRNLVVIDRKGNAVDKDVEELFPHGIDLDLVKQIALDTDENFLADSSWKQYISFAILLPNFNKNKNLISDRKFHATVKAFVESAAVKIWLYRIKLQKLLEDTMTSLEIHLDKKFFTGNELFSQTVVNLYPIFFPIFVDSRNMEKLRFICSSMAAISAVAYLNHNGSEGFHEIRRTSEVLLKDYRNLRRLSQEFMDEYD